MKVMFTVLCLTLGFSGLSAHPCLKSAQAYTLYEIEQIVCALANSKGVAPSVILNRLLRKVRYRQTSEKTKDSLQDLALEELLGTKYRPPSPPGNEEILGPPSQSVIPPPDNNPPFPSPVQPPPPPSRPEAEPQQPFHTRQPPPGQRGMMTGVFFSPSFSHKDAPNRQPYPLTFFVPVQNLKPPPGVTIRVQTDVRESALPDVTVTLSPMMTIAEALKQAESKYRSLLGLSSSVLDDGVLSFDRSSVAECYIISSFNGVQSDDRGYWKIVVNDKSTMMVYDGVCLPTRSELAVKPGMTITLLHTPV